MRAQDFITEVGDKPYKMGRWKYGSITVILPDNRELRINFESLGWGTVLFSFSVDDEVGTTGGGDVIRILSTVSRALNDYVDGHYPELIVWGVRGDDVSRVKLFDRITDRWLQLPALSGVYTNITDRHDLWPQDLDTIVRQTHGSNLKIYVLASSEYMQDIEGGITEATTPNYYDDPRGSDTLSTTSDTNIIGPPAGKDGLLTLEMQQQLVDGGYKYIDHGAEHSVWLGPDGYVYKIMPPRYIRSEVVQQLQYGNVSPDHIYLTHSQRAFLDWVEYCRARPNNPFLPYYDDWQTYVRPYTRKLHGKEVQRYYVYLQCRTERLFPLPRSWKDSMSNLSIRMKHNSMKSIIMNPEGTIEILSHIGNEPNEFPLLYRTVQQLQQWAENHGYRLDLHGDNYMVGEDGQIVINDPFFIDYTAKVR